MMIKTTAMMMMIRMIFMALKYGFQNWFCCSCCYWCWYWCFCYVVVNGSPLLTCPWKCKMNELLVEMLKIIDIKYGLDSYYGIIELFWFIELFWILRHYCYIGAPSIVIICKYLEHEKTNILLQFTHKNDSIILSLTWYMFHLSIYILNPFLHEINIAILHVQFLL